MKKFKATLIGSIITLGLCSQIYMVDIGSPTYKERCHDALILGDDMFTSHSLVVGVTNVDGYDRILLTSMDLMTGSVNYQKKYNVAYPTTSKERTVVTSVKIAHDNTSASTTCMMAGSYMRTDMSGVPFAYGLFSLTFDGSNGNILNIKRWASSVAGVTMMSVASVCAGPGNNFYLTGNIKYATAELYMHVMALNSSNTLIWNKIDHDTPTLTENFNVTSIVYSPFSITGANEVVVAGYCQPYMHGNASDIFFRRFNAATGTLLSQSLFSTGNTEAHLVASIVPSLSSLGVYDGFLICGTREDNTATKCAWVVKTNSTGSAITWSKNYKYNVAGSQFVGNDILEAYGAPANSFYVIGTATNGISGPTSDAAAFRIDANGAVVWFNSFVPSINTTNKNEEAIVAVQNSTFTNGLNIYGNRVNPSNPALSDIYALRVADLGPTSVYNCERVTETPYVVSDVPVTVSSYTTMDYAVLNSSTFNQTITAVNYFTQVCYDSMLVGERLMNVNEVTDPQPEIIYPNPSAGQFTLVRDSEIPASVEIYDMMGRAVIEPMQMTGTTLVFDLGTLPPGIYVVNIRSSLETKTMRIIKQ